MPFRSLVALLSLCVSAASLAGCAGITAAASPSRLVTYPAPGGARLNDAFSVKVRTPGGAWHDVPTYRIHLQSVDPVSGMHSRRDSSLAGFDFTGVVEVAVTSRRGDIGSARVRPLSCGITPSVRGDTLAFTLDRPRKLSVEIDGDIFGNLQLFANSIEASRPSPGDPDVIYFGAGLHSLPEDVLRVPSGKTVYLAGGAVIRGDILFDGVKNARLVGRGMLDQEYGRVRIDFSENIEVRGIFARQVFTGSSRHVTISDVMCISCGAWGDGMNVVAGHDVLIEDVFNRNSDDCVTVYATRGEKRRRQFPRHRARRHALGRRRPPDPRRHAWRSSRSPGDRGSALRKHRHPRSHGDADRLPGLPGRQRGR